MCLSFSYFTIGSYICIHSISHKVFFWASVCLKSKRFLSALTSAFLCKFDALALVSSVRSLLRMLLNRKAIIAFILSHRSRRQLVNTAGEVPAGVLVALELVAHSAASGLGA